MSTTRGTQPRRSWFWWIVMIISTAVSITLNLWHSLTVHPDPAVIKDACVLSADLCKHAAAIADRVFGLHPVLGIINAIVPPGFAAIMSHGLVDDSAKKPIKVWIIALFGLSMLTSVWAQATVMQPYGGGHLGEWTIPIVLDSAALISLHMITSRSGAERAAARLAELRAELRPLLVAEVREEMSAEVVAATAAAEAEVKRNWAAELDAARAAGKAEAADAARVEAAAAAAAREDDIRAQTAAETEARVRAEMRAAGRLPVRRKDPSGAARSPADGGETTMQKAKRLLAANPDMKGAELGRARGKTERYGRDLLAQIKNRPDDPDAPPQLHAVP